MKRPRILFVFPSDAPFVRTDLELLRGSFIVTPFLVEGRHQYPTILRLISKVDLVVCWFALGFSAMAGIGARLMGRPCITVAGGWDVTGMPEIGYGRLISSRGRLTAAVALSVASEVLAFSDWSKEEIRRVAPRSHVRTSYLGVDTRKFAPAQEKEMIVVCIAHVTRENLSRKGLCDFVRAAQTVPQAQFVLVGKHFDDAIKELRGIAGPNVAFPGRITDEELRDLLSRAKVYAQPSYTEGFGVALAEAMSSGCVPVVTKAGALPEVVGEAGLYVKYGDPTMLADAIRKALNSGLGLGARRRIEERFTLERRLTDLRRAVWEALHLAKIPQAVSAKSGSASVKDHHED